VSAKEFLLQATLIDQRINCKLEQVQSLRSLAEKATTTLTPTPHSDQRNIHRIEDIIIKMLDLESDINASIDRLVDGKREIMETIRCLPKAEHRSLLELRYICGKTWEEVALKMQYSVRNIHLIHGAALHKVSELIEKDVVS